MVSALQNLLQTIVVSILDGPLEWPPTVESRPLWSVIFGPMGLEGADHVDNDRQRKGSSIQSREKSGS